MQSSYPDGVSILLQQISQCLSQRKNLILYKDELAQNLARENLQRAQQKMKDYYDQKTKEPVI